MHRSGTSLVASTLAAAGIQMGPRLLAGDAHNPHGYFEDLDFLDLDRRMLAAACPPDDGGHPDWGWTESESLDVETFERYRDEASALLAARSSQGSAWGFKDPRASLLLDFYLSFAPGARFLLTYRFPWEVADSIQHLGADAFLRRPDYAYRIWAFYNRHLLDFHRSNPDRSVLVSIDAAVENSSRMAELLRKKLQIEASPDALARQLDPGLLRRTSRNDPLIRLAGMVHPECFELLELLDAAAEVSATGRWHCGPLRPRVVAGEPRVSVVIPCCDDGDFLIEAMASVERSLTLPFEMIVVDDGSREPRTRSILDSLDDAGFDVRRRPHLGLAAARNHGFAVARAPFVVPLDSDNLLLPGFMEQALALLDEDPRLAAAYGDRVEFGLRSGRVTVGPFDPDLLIAGNYVDACAVIRRQAWEECGGYDEMMPAQGYEDWELWVASIARGWELGWLPYPAFAYRVRPDSVLSRLKGSVGHAEAQSYLVAKHRELFRASLRRLIGELRSARQDVELQRKALQQESSALAETRAELGKTRSDLREVVVHLEETQRSLRNVEEESRAAATEAQRSRQESEALGRQNRQLHGLLDVWRQRLKSLESTRAVRWREQLLRIRSRIERRSRTSAAEPCVIGATGGSGTRVFARISERGGLFLGTERNEFEDALPVERFLDAWLVPFWKSGGYAPPHLSPPGMDDAFFAALREQFADHAGHGPRGWKCPRNLYLLPFLAQRFPDLRFLHVVRDGRDMAFSSNQLQLARYGTLILSSAEQAWSEAERSIALWSRINSLASELGEQMGGAYLRVRLEDLCENPVEVTRRVFRFFGLPGDPRAAAGLVEIPPSLGHWQRADPELVARLEEIGGGALWRFGYSGDVRPPTAPRQARGVKGPPSSSGQRPGPKKHSSPRSRDP
jgi:GT2 family glycosyltransferase